MVILSTFFLFQSVGDGGQGWCNGILYILLSPNIRQRLLSILFSPLTRCAKLLCKKDPALILNSKDKRTLEYTYTIDL